MRGSHAFTTTSALTLWISAEIASRSRASICSATNFERSSSNAIASSARDNEISARTKVLKNDRVSAIDAIEAPTPPAPITKIFITHQFVERTTFVVCISIDVSLPLNLCV